MDAEEGPVSLEEIPPLECVELLRGSPVGRLAVSLPGRPPLVVPVNYVLDGDVVVFRSDPGSKLFALRRRAVAFEVDSIDPLHHTGWSVLIHGIAYEAAPAEVAHLRVEPWAGGTKRHWVRIIPTTITGRRIRLAGIVVADPQGYL